jgi:hypothetical protein
VLVSVMPAVGRTTPIFGHCQRLEGRRPFWPLCEEQMTNFFGAQGSERVYEADAGIQLRIAREALLYSWYADNAICLTATTSALC